MRIVFLSLFLLASLFAHKLNLFISQEKENVVVSSYFASGSFCKDCKVEVFDKNKKLIESGKTDKNGEYILKNPQSKINVRVEAIGGHAVSNEFELKNLTTKVEKTEEEYKIYETLIAILLIGGIFFLLKRVKRKENNE